MDYDNWDDYIAAWEAMLGKEKVAEIGAAVMERAFSEETAEIRGEHGQAQ